MRATLRSPAEEANTDACSAAASVRHTITIPDLLADDVVCIAYLPLHAVELTHGHVS